MNATQLDPLVSAAIVRWSPLAGVAIPAVLVRAIIQVESSGNPNVVGAAGELGLMQVMPATARTLGLADPRQLVDPATGIDVGVHYLAQQLARYAGRIPHAIAAYNAGTARFDQQEQFINQGYVDRVLAVMRQLSSPLLAGAIAAGIGFAIWLSRRRRAA